MTEIHGCDIHTWRGRRLALFRACDEIEKIIWALDIEAACKSLDIPLAINESHKLELVNQLSVLKRTILLWNDGRVQPDRLNPY